MIKAHCCFLPIASVAHGRADSFGNQSSTVNDPIVFEIRAQRINYCRALIGQTERTQSDSTRRFPVFKVTCHDWADSAG